MQFQIDYDVPVPPRGPRGGETAYPFVHMEVGASFAVADRKEALKIARAAATFAKRHEGFRFTSRTMEEGTRIWRIPA